MGLVAGRAVAGADQGARQVQLGAVDSEGAVAVPQRAGPVPGQPLEDGAVSAAEDLLVHLGAGLADRRGRDRLRLRQGHLELAAVVPQLGQHRGVAAPVGREHQPEHEQHHQQRVEGPPALDPLPVVRARHAHQGADQLLPELHEARPGPRRAAARLGRLGRALLQDPAPVRMQRVHVHILGRLGRHSAHRPARLRLADALPVGCPVAGPLMLPRVHVGLGQHRPAAVPPLPVLRQLPQRQPQGLRRQALHLDPREQHEASVAHHQVEMPVVPADRPADPLVAAAHVAGGEVEQQAAQLALLAIEQEVAQVRAQRLPIAQVLHAELRSIRMQRHRGASR